MDIRERKSNRGDFVNVHCCVRHFANDELPLKANHLKRTQRPVFRGSIVHPKVSRYASAIVPSKMSAYCATT